MVRPLYEVGLGTRLMFSISKDDIVAVRRAYMAGGRDRAMAEAERVNECETPGGII